tara:strand:+ start:778 stop:2355 length:1578 start_codon:yes stop_codon:yes gene_type:complete
MIKSNNENKDEQTLKELNINSVSFTGAEMKNDFDINTKKTEYPSKEQLINKAFKFHSQGNIIEAAKYYQYCIEKNFNDSRIYSNYSIILKGIGKLKEAEKFQRKAIQCNPNLAESYYNLGIILKDIGKEQEAYDSYIKAIKIKADFPQAFVNLGLLLKDMDKLKDAELYTRKAIQINPNLAEAHCNLGIILVDLGKLKEARISLRKSIKLNPEMADSYCTLGKILLDSGENEEAEILTYKAIKLNQNLQNAHYNLGNILRQRGKLNEAELSLLKAIKIKPDFSLALRDLSICQYLMGKKYSALNSIKKANSLDPKEVNNKILLKIFSQTKEIGGGNKYLKKEISNNGKNNLYSNPIRLNRPVEKELINRLYKIKARDQEKHQDPTFGNAKGSDYALFEINDLIIKNIKEELTNIARNSIHSDIFIVDSFFTIFRSGGGLKSHNHINKLDKINGLNLAERKFSLVYYLSVGDQSCDEPGILKLEDPSQNILPNDGLIIIFPAERQHSVFYKGQKDRIIIGVNFYVI